MTTKMSASMHIAHPYAQAAFDYAMEQKELDQWTNMLAFAASCVQLPQVAEILKNPRYSIEVRYDIILSFSKEVLNQAGKNFIKILAIHQRLTALPPIYALFQQLCAAARKILHAKVKSVVPLTDAHLKQLNALLVKRFERDVELESEIDTSLIGGVVIYVGDQIIDNSLRGRLEKLKEAVTR